MILDPDPLSCILIYAANLLQSQTSLSAISFTAPDLGCWIAIAIALIGLLFSAFNSGSEIAYFSLSNKDIESIEEDYKRERVEHLLAKPERLLATILIGNNLVNIMIVILLNYAMNGMLGDDFKADD